MGLSLRGVRRLKERLVKLCASEESPFKVDAVLLKNRKCAAAHSFDELTTTQLVHMWVKEKAVTGDKRLAEVAALIDPDDVGLPTYFISHAWQSTVAKLFSTIEAFLADASDNTCAWCMVTTELYTLNPFLLCAGILIRFSKSLLLNTRI